MKDILPILKSFKVRFSAPFLLALQIAVTFTLLVNAFFMIEQKVAMTSKPSGVDEANIIRIAANHPYQGDESIARLDETIAGIQALPAVQQVSFVNSVPLAGRGRTDGVSRTAEGRRETWTATFLTDAQILSTLGLKLIAGQDFTLGEERTVNYQAQSVSTPIIISKALAERLYPEDWQKALGQTLYLSAVAHPIKGIVEHLNGPWGWWHSAEIAVIKPVREADVILTLVARALPGQSDEAIGQIRSYLMQMPGRQIHQLDKFVDIRAKNYEKETASLNTLWIVLSALSFVTILGIFGQARFAIMKRRKHIGIRRALGASHWHVLRYFLTENLLITCVGVLFGVIFAIVLNQHTITRFDFSLIPATYFVFGGVFCVVLGQLAVLLPAWQASQLSPAIATRSV
jgi:putative ABC transport system permease protein